MGMFDGMATAEVFEKGKFFAPGEYDLKVKKMIGKNTQRAGYCVIVEFTILASDHPEFPVGSDASWVQPMRHQQAALSSLKEFLIALAGLRLEDKAQIASFSAQSPIVFDHAISAANPFAGLGIHLSAFTRAIQNGPNAGKPFTVHAWRPLVPGSEGQLARIQALAGAPVAPVFPAQVVPQYPQAVPQYVPPPQAAAAMPYAPATPPPLTGALPPAPPGWKHDGKGGIVPA